jgi:hypothetical protein
MGTQGCIRVVGMSNAAKSLREREVSQRGFLWWSVGRHRKNGEMSGSCRQGGEREGEKMASMMKVMVGSEGSRCHHDERPRSRGPRGKLRGACT